jgi:hypothetical protein
LEEAMDLSEERQENDNIMQIKSFCIYIFILNPIYNIYIKRRINNQLDADKLRFIDVISSTCFWKHYAHHQEYRSEPTDRL